ncbi:GrpB family protein [Streptococcus rifensis]
MVKPLEEMTLEELWQLFPIFLVEHKSEWQDWYADEKSELEKLLGADVIKSIEHIGSTAIPAIWAKNIVDILLQVENPTDMMRAQAILVANGWRLMSESSNRMSFNKGYTENGFADRVFHLHLRLSGDCDELYFRDYLRQHPDLAQDYQKLKLSLWKKFEHDRDGYTEAKSDFIQNYTHLAKEVIPDING